MHAGVSLLHYVRGSSGKPRVQFCSVTQRPCIRNCSTVTVYPAGGAPVNGGTGINQLCLLASRTGPHLTSDSLSSLSSSSSGGGSGGAW